MPSRLLRIALIVPIVLCLTFAARRYLLDDALIYAVYVRNALTGHGLVFNPGEPVNALTSPLFALLLFVVSWMMHGQTLLAELLLSAVFYAAACVLAELIAPLAGLLLACLPFFYLCFGMETALFLFMLVLTLYLYVNNKFRWLPLVALLTVLTRFEGAALVALIAIDMARARRWPSLKSFLAPVVIVILYMEANYRLFHHFLPGSLSAKFQQGHSQLWGKWPKAFMWRPVQVLTAFPHCLYLAPVLLALVVLAYRKLRGTAMQALIPQFLVVLLLFYIIFNIPNYHWYDAPLIFLGLLYAMLGLPQNKIACGCVAFAAAGFFVFGLHYLPRQQQAWHDEYRQVAEWAGAHAAPGGRIAAVETGTIAWYCHCNVEDIMGITDPANGKLLAHHDLRSWIKNRPPEYVVMHKPPIFGEVAAAESPDYQRVVFDAGHIYLVQREPLR